eukprot:7384213-Prymnesium_polylepis.1
MYDQSASRGEWSTCCTAARLEGGKRDSLRHAARRRAQIREGVKQEVGLDVREKSKLDRMVRKQDSAIAKGVRKQQKLPFTQERAQDEQLAPERGDAVSRHTNPERPRAGTRGRWGPRASPIRHQGPRVPGRVPRWDSVLGAPREGEPGPTVRHRSDTRVPGSQGPK